MFYFFIFFALLLSTTHSTQAAFLTKQEVISIYEQFNICLQSNNHQQIKLILESMDNKYKKQLLEALIECNTSTLLHYAVRNDLYEISELLLKHGAHVNAKDFYGQTPLQTAAANLYNLDMFKLLLKYKVDINTQDYYNKDTALHIIFKRLVENEGLHYALDLPIIGLLISRKPNVNLKNNDGDTLLHLAAQIPMHFSCDQKTHQINLFECSCKLKDKLLLLFKNKSANLQIKNNKFETAFDTATRVNNFILVRLMGSLLAAQKKETLCYFQRY